MHWDYKSITPIATSSQGYSHRYRAQVLPQHHIPHNHYSIPWCQEICLLFLHYPAQAGHFNFPCSQRAGFLCKHIRLRLLHVHVHHSHMIRWAKTRVTLWNANVTVTEESLPRWAMIAFKSSLHAYLQGDPNNDAEVGKAWPGYICNQRNPQDANSMQGLSFHIHQVQQLSCIPTHSCITGTQSVALDYGQPRITVHSSRSFSSLIKYM